jgi:hypothetical protein
MTSIIKQIETKSLNVNAFIKKNSAYILNESIIIGNKKDTLKADDFRNWVFSTNEIDIKFMFDEKGKPNKKGEVKKIMSQHYKNVMNGIMKIYNNQDLFIDWVKDEEYKKGNSTTSIAKISNVLTQYEKHLNPSTNETDTEETETETDTEETETENNNEINLEKLFDFIETLNNQDLGLTLEYCQDLQAKRINNIRKAS